MTLTYNKDGKLEFDFHELLREDLSCDEAIIKHVADQILDRWTENGYGGARECGASPNPFCALDKARREVSKHSSEIAKETIESLEKSLKETKDELHKLREEIYWAKNRTY